MKARRRLPAALWLPLLALLTLLLLALGWQWLAREGVLTLEALRALAASTSGWRDAPWTLLVVMAVYAGASLVMFPLSLLVGVTGLLFGPWWGFGYALAGTLTASLVTWWVGRRIGREALLRHGGKRLRGLSRYLARRGIRTMTVVNLLPLAPFTLTNMMAGAFRLRLRDYLVGSALGIAPGLAGVTLLGSQLGKLATAESRDELAWGAGGLLLAVLLLVALKRWSDHRRRR
ncbi:TVP38/TMEM64 family protein [Halomonas sp. A11-A]|uniref:TVP38/TMEM64 family protein n=1 Tax=Halomonas sp. A11-A TaxID=2183985 RepID=UPI000D716987|nr:TVP38/TMEM64 family protein [Halomonas sp. A11-A]PWV75867.1 putative membrane protein YdjX (TVP38/TMEM64 family) [Halomonas sp. A11-A]